MADVTQHSGDNTVENTAEKMVNGPEGLDHEVKLLSKQFGGVSHSEARLPG